MERGFFERGPRAEIIETEVELRELRRSFGSIVRHGTKDELAKLLDSQPQRSKNGKLIWLLTSGMAVEVATGIERQHHDLDVVVMDPKNIWRWEILGTDNITPGQYWADMNFDPKYLEKTACKTSFAIGAREYTVEIVHPSIVMAQKLSNAFGRDPREKDIVDAKTVVEWWKKYHSSRSTWINIVDKAVDALPRGQQKLTTRRIVDFVPKVVPRKKN